MKTLDISGKTIDIFEKIPYPVVIHLDGNIVAVNMAAAKLCHVDDKASLIGANILGFLNEESRVKAIRYMQNDEEYDGELFEMMDPTGENHEIEIKKSFFYEHGMRYTFLVIKDVTEYRRGLVRAAKIQRKTMSGDLKDVEGLGFEQGYLPKETVSGDFYYHEVCGSGCVIGILGDVKGKGLSAALSTSAMKILFYEAVERSISTKAMANRINDGIMKLLGEEFVAAIIFRIDLSNKLVSVTGAGISEFLIKTPEGMISKEVVRGPFLGMFPDDMFENRHYTFERGSEIIFYSDGLEMEGLADRMLALKSSEGFVGRMKVLEDLCKKEAQDDRTWAVFRAM